MLQGKNKLISIISLMVFALAHSNIAHSVTTGKIVTAIAEAIIHPPRLGHNVPIEVLRKLSPYCLMPLNAYVGLRKIRLSALVVNPAANVKKTGVANTRATCSIRDIANVPTSATMVMLPGIEMPKSALLPYANFFATLGVRCILIDLRGQGSSGGKNIGLLVKDVSDMRSLISQLRAKRLISGNLGLFGLSYGAAVALDLAAYEPKIALVISVAPFSRTAEAMKKFISNYDPKLLRNVDAEEWEEVVNRVNALVDLDLAKGNPIRRVGFIKAFVFYIGGANDSISPPQAIIKLAGLTPERSILIAQNRDHLGITSDWQLVTSASDQYVEQYLLHNKNKMNGASPLLKPRRDAVGGTEGKFSYREMVTRQL